MQILISLLILLYIGALSRSLLPNAFAEDSGSSIEKIGTALAEKDRFLATKKNQSHVEDPNKAQVDYLPLMTQTSRGVWSALDFSNRPESFIHKSGFATFVAHRKGLGNSEDFLEVWLYDGKFIDNKAAKISFIYDNNTDFNPRNSTYKNQHIGLQVIEFDKFSEKAVKICQGSYQLDFIDALTNTPYERTNGGMEDIAVQIWIESNDCNFSVQGKIGLIDAAYESNTMDYSIFMTLICLFHLYACIQMIRTVNNAEATGHGYSLVTLALLTAWDIFLCFFHLYEAINMDINFFHYFISPAFWYFILASIFETRLLTVVWKARYYRQFETVSEVRRGYASFYLRLYGLLSSTILSSYLLLPYLWFSCFTAIFFVPQIVHNFVRGQKPKFDWMYVFFFGATRILLPLYSRGCPISIFKLTPNTTFVSSYIGIVFFQIVILYLQSKLGSRFFVPACLLPPKYSYFVKVNIEMLVKEENCAICMDCLSQEPSSLKTPILKGMNNSSAVQVMKTPCKHMFHEKCLKDWMQIKFECPYCRSSLPCFD